MVGGHWATFVPPVDGLRCNQKPTSSVPMEEGQQSFENSVSNVVALPSEMQCSHPRHMLGVMMDTTGDERGDDDQMLPQNGPNWFQYVLTIQVAIQMPPKQIQHN